MKYRPTEEQLKRIKYHVKNYKIDSIVLYELYKAEAFNLSNKRPWINFQDIKTGEWRICPGPWKDISSEYAIVVDMSPMVKTIGPDPIVGKVIIPNMQSFRGIDLMNGAKVRPISYRGYLCLEIDNPREFREKVVCGYSLGKLTILE